MDRNHVVYRQADRPTDIPTDISIKLMKVKANNNMPPLLLRRRGHNKYMEPEPDRQTVNIYWERLNYYRQCLWKIL